MKTHFDARSDPNWNSPLKNSKHEITYYHWTYLKSWTTDPSKVTCKKCLQKIQQHKERPIKHTKTRRPSNTYLVEIPIIMVLKIQTTKEKAQTLALERLTSLKDDEIIEFERLEVDTSADLTYYHVTKA